MTTSSHYSEKEAATALAALSEWILSMSREDVEDRFSWEPLCDDQYAACDYYMRFDKTLPADLTSVKAGAPEAVTSAWRTVDEAYGAYGLHALLLSAREGQMPRHDDFIGGRTSARLSYTSQWLACSSKGTVDKAALIRAAVPEVLAAGYPAEQLVEVAMSVAWSRAWHAAVDIAIRTYLSYIDHGYPCPRGYAPGEYDHGW